MNKTILKPITLKDTDNIVKWRNSRAVNSNFIIREKLTKKQHLWWMKNKVSKGLVHQFVAFDSKTGKAFGTTYLKDVDKKSKKAEFGIFIGEKEYRNKKYGQVITKQTIEYGFKKLKLNKIYARILSYNKPSYKLFNNLHFKQDALLRDDVYINNKYYDVYIMSILKSDYINKR